MVIPFLEIVVFMTVGQYIGFWTTLLLAFGTAILGGIIIRIQGLHKLMELRSGISNHNSSNPLDTIFDGICLVIAGGFLITPGFVTDAAGFLLLAPPIRAILRNIVLTKFQIQGISNSPHNYRQSSAEIIEAEDYEVGNDDKP